MLFLFDFCVLFKLNSFENKSWKYAKILAKVTKLCYNVHINAGECSLTHYAAFVVLKYRLIKKWGLSPLSQAIRFATNTCFVIAEAVLWALLVVDTSVAVTPGKVTAGMPAGCGIWGGRAVVVTTWGTGAGAGWGWGSVFTYSRAGHERMWLVSLMRFYNEFLKTAWRYTSLLVSHFSALLTFNLLVTVTYLKKKKKIMVVDYYGHLPYNNAITRYWSWILNDKLLVREENLVLGNSSIPFAPLFSLSL